MEKLYRLAAAVPRVTPGDPRANAAAMASLFERAAADGAAVTVMPELALTGHLGDLLTNRQLLAAAEQGAAELAAATRDLPGALIVGSPLPVGDRLFNAALVIQGGAVVGAAVKTHLPNRLEANDGRWFSPAAELPETEIEYAGSTFPLRRRALFSDGVLCFGVEFEDDLAAVTPPSHELALNGAAAILSPAAHPEGLGADAARRRRIMAASERLTAAYLAAGAGFGESGGDAAFAGHALIAVDGALRAETDDADDVFISADLPVAWITHLRRARRDFHTTPADSIEPLKLAPLPAVAGVGRLAPDPTPFVPKDPGERRARCAEVLRIQSGALARRIVACHAERMVLGISGGLDSTLAMLAAIETCRSLGWKPDRLLTVTMPGFGTTGRTRGNAEDLAELLGAELRVVPIADAVRGHFRDIGHDEAERNTVYENSQARERTQILMDLANAVNGLVIGTGDLSEIALGWCTFNGDHMAMYGVNAGVPKSLIRPMLETAAEKAPEAVAAILRDICATPVSPELLPGAQHTESILGSYELHDFYLYYFLKYGETPETLLELAEAAFADRVDRAALTAALETFGRRFFVQQFKRNCSPEAPQISEISLAARGGWEMPSLIDPAFWRK